MSALIYKKMNLVMADIGAIGKDQKNLAQGFKFRGIDQFVNALYPALVKHGVFMTTEVLKQEQELKEVTRSNGKAGVDKHISIQMRYTFHAEDGSFVSSSVPGEACDSGDKGTNKALSAALKYALIQTFSIPTEDMAEADFDSPEIGLPAKKEPQLPVTKSAPAPKPEPTKPTPVAPVAEAAPAKPTSSFRKTTPKAAVLAPEPEGEWK